MNYKTLRGDMSAERELLDKMRGFIYRTLYVGVWGQDTGEQLLGEYDALPKGGEAVQTARTVIDLLLTVCVSAFVAMDDSADHGEGFMRVPHESFDSLSKAMDALDELPDDRPGYVMGPAAKAEWTLRTLAPAPQTREPNPLDMIVGLMVSMDVSKGEDDSTNRIFGKVYSNQDGDTILAIEDHRNFKDAQTREPTIEDAGYVARFISDPLDASPETMLAALRVGRFLKVVT